LTIKRLARRFLGSLYDPLQRTWSGARFRWNAAARQRRQDRVWRRLTRDGIRVLSGPFAGMQYLEEPAEGSIYPKLLGTYERELAPVFETIVATPYDVVVDIGAAEGYYAVGLAMRMPSTVVHAYDVDARSRASCAELARRNGVADRVHVHGAFAAQDFGAQRMLVICDCEGCELQVLHPQTFRNADVLVELHDFLDPTITPTIVARFRETHTITLLDTRPRELDLPVLRRLRASDRAFAVDERRPAAMQWAWMVAR
jgi:hypothetical protein